MSEFFKKAFIFAAGCAGLVLGNVIGTWILEGI